MKSIVKILETNIGFTDVKRLTNRIGNLYGITTNVAQVSKERDQFTLSIEGKSAMVDSAMEDICNLCDGCIIG